MKVKYLGETTTMKSVSGKDVKLEKSGEYECMEKEYHSALFVRIVVDGDHVKVRRADLKKV